MEAYLGLLQYLKWSSRNTNILDIWREKDVLGMALISLF